MSQLIANIIFLFSFYLLISISYYIIYDLTKFYHIAHAVVISYGAYAVYFLTNNFSFSFSLSVIIGILFSVCLGFLCEILIYRQMRKRNVAVQSYLIASIGLYNIFQNCISLYFGDDTKIINPIEVSVGYQVFGAYITQIQLTTIAVSCFVFITINLFLKFTDSGKSIRAIANNPELSNIYGISSNKYIFIAFGIGSAIAGATGILSAMDTNMTPTFGFKIFFYGVVVMIIGGVGSFKGLLFSSIILAIAQNLVGYFLDTKWMDTTTYIILIGFLLWKPLGFSGKKLKKLET